MTRISLIYNQDLQDFRDYDQDLPDSHDFTGLNADFQTEFEDLTTFKKILQIKAIL